MDMPADLVHFFEKPTTAYYQGENIDFFEQSISFIEKQKSISLIGLNAGSRHSTSKNDSIIPQKDLSDLIDHIRFRLTNEIGDSSATDIKIISGHNTKKDLAEYLPPKNQKLFLDGKEYWSKNINIGPFTQAQSNGTGKVYCVISASSPKFDVQNFLSTIYDHKINSGGLSSTDLHKWYHWHEVGHCLLGSSEIHADTFGLLVSLQEGAQKNLFSFVSVAREAYERLSPVSWDTYYTSPAAKWIYENYDTLSNNQTFKNMKLQEIAALSKIIADRLEKKESYVKDSMKIRSVISASSEKKTHWHITTNGLQPIGYRDWLKEHRDIPEFNQAYEILTKLEDGTSSPTDFKEVDIKNFDYQVKKIADQGDPTAKFMVEYMKNIPKSEQPFKTGSLPVSTYSISETRAKLFFDVPPDSKTHFSPDQSFCSIYDSDDITLHSIIDSNTGIVRSITPQNNFKHQ